MNIKLEEPPAGREMKPRPPLPPAPIHGGRPPKLEVLDLADVVGVEQKLSLPPSLSFGKDPNNNNGGGDNNGGGGGCASANTNHNSLLRRSRAAPIINHQRRHTEVGKLNGKI
jgi:hypothetical protein